MDRDHQHYLRRACFLWPRLAPDQLRRTRGDPTRIAGIVARRTSLPPDAIVGMLRMSDVAQDDRP